MPEEMQARIKRIYEGTPAEQAGRAWIENELNDPAYTAGIPVDNEGHFIRKPITEPEHGAEMVCFWDSHSKAWQPDYPWPTVLPQEDYKGEREE